MRAFWILLVRVGGIALLGYATLIALSVLDISWSPRHFDTGVTTVEEPGWVNEARYAMINKVAFDAPRDRVVILGASTSRDPFRPELMEQRLPGWTVANASLSGANVSEIADFVDVYYAERQGHPPSRTAFLFALTYIQFKPVDYSRNAASPFATEAMRSGFYAREGGRLVATLPSPFEHMIATVMRPQAIAASLTRRVSKFLFVNPDFPALKSFADRFRARDPLSRWTQAIGEARDLNQLNPTPEMQSALLAQRLGDAGDTPYPDSEYKKLAAAIGIIRAHGDLAVVVDLPLPEWHRAGVRRIEAAHDAHIAAVLAGFGGDPAITRLSLRQFGADTNFFDSGHPKPKMWSVFSATLADLLRPFLEKNDANARVSR